MDDPPSSQNWASCVAAKSITYGSAVRFECHSKHRRRSGESPDYRSQEDEGGTDLHRMPPEIISTIRDSLPCTDVARLCSIDRGSLQLCDEDFWKQQSEMRGWASEGRLNPFHKNTRKTVNHPNVIGETGKTWKEHYAWWCQRVHTNESLRTAVKEVEVVQTDFHGNPLWYFMKDTIYNPCIHTHYGHISEWDVSQVTDMSRLFSKGYSSTILDLSNWDVSNVTNMEEMFANCGELRLTGLPRWNVSKVTNMARMFTGSDRFLKIDLSTWDVSKVTTMQEMFSNVRGKVELFDFSAWRDKLSNVTNMSSMFSWSPNLNPNVSEWNVASVTHMEHMFRKAPKFNGDLSKWNVSPHAITTDMFEGSGVTTPPSWYTQESMDVS